MDYDDELRLMCMQTGDPLCKPYKRMVDEAAERLAKEFEDEMDMELDDLVQTNIIGWEEQPVWTYGSDNTHTVSDGLGSVKDANPSTSGREKFESDISKVEFYDKDYFDSSDEDELRDRRVKSNDELLYDPEADDLDEEWMKEQSGFSKSENSDAILNCPSCMTTLCVDCQRHEKYHSQYRAMFSLNCNINTTEVLRYTKKQKKQRGRTKNTIQDRRRNSRSRSRSLGRASDATDENPEDLYHPVTCKICDTEVGVFDSDELIHFFNVIASYK